MVSECVSRMVAHLSLSDSSEGWHLRKTNWEGEAVEAVEDGSVTLDQEGIKVRQFSALGPAVFPLFQGLSVLLFGTVKPRRRNVMTLMLFSLGAS